MTGFRRTTLVLAVTLLAVACGSTAPQTGAAVPPAGPPSMATTVATASGTWAVLVMGGSAARHNNFWELFARPPGATAWRLVTPPGVASNGGVLVAPAGGGSAVVAFVPSQALAFSPLATTTDGGATWSAGLLDARLAALPTALAATPRDGRLLALLSDGTAETSSRGAAHWTRLATRRSLASTAAGRRCGTGSPSAISFGSNGTPVLAAACTRARTAGIFAFGAGTWHLAGPALPASLAAPTSVLSLWGTGTGQAALLAAGTGRGAAVVAAWSRNGRWALSRPLPLHDARVRSLSLGTGGAIGIILNDQAGATVAAPGASWRRLPRLPAGTQTLAPGPGGRVDALAAARSVFTDWAWSTGSPRWARVQKLHVPIQYGSSG